jgi:hypothetical protein
VLNFLLHGTPLGRCVELAKVGDGLNFHQLLLLDWVFLV